MNKPTGEEIIEFIHSHWKNQTCPMCGGRTWNVSDKVFELRNSTMEILCLEDQTRPLFH